MWSWSWPRVLASGRSPWRTYQGRATSPNTTAADGARNIPSRSSAGQLRSGPRGTVHVDLGQGRAAGAAGIDRRVEVGLVPELRAVRIVLVEMHVVEPLGRVIARVLHQRLVGAPHVAEAAGTGRLHAGGQSLRDLRLREAGRGALARPRIAADEDRAALVGGVERQELEIGPRLEGPRGWPACRARASRSARSRSGVTSAGGVATRVNRTRTSFGAASAGRPPHRVFVEVGKWRT